MSFPILSYLKIIFLGSSVILFIYVSWLLYEATPGFPIDSSQHEHTSRPYDLYHIKKPVMRVFDRDLLKIRMVADSVSLSPSKFFIFRINAIKKPVVINPVLDFYYYDVSDSMPDISFFEILQLPTNNHKIALHHVKWNFFRNHKQVLSVASRKAHIYLKQRQIHFLAAILTLSGSSSTIRPTKLVWDDSLHQFSGWYDNHKLRIHPNKILLE